jgi:hypothetical protein
MKYLKLFENYQNYTNGNYLFHATNIKNLDDIQNYGLLPQFGETVKQAYGGYYKMGEEEFDSEGNELPELKMEGLLFFGDKPHLKYSSNIYERNFDWSKALLCIIEKNETIFKKIDDYPRFIDYEGNPAYSYDGVSFMDDLPIIVETGDWFSFEEQSVEKILYGKELYDWMQKNFPKEFEELNKK